MQEQGVWRGLGALQLPVQTHGATHSCTDLPASSAVLQIGSAHEQHESVLEVNCTGNPADEEQLTWS